MSALAILKKAADVGLSVTLSEAGKLRLSAPVPPSPELIEELRQNKPAIIAELSSRALEPGPPAAPPLPAPPIRCELPFGCDHVPPRLQAAWQALLAQCPPAVTPIVWQAAIFDAALLFGDFGKLIAEYRWTPGDLFDVPQDGKSGGLVWFLKGSPVVAIGRSIAQCRDGRIWRRMQ